MAMTAQNPTGPPYQPHTAALGSVPNVSTDVPVSAVFVAIFASLAATHMILFQRNNARGHFFAFSAVTFGFCMARVVTFVMRIVWATHQTNIRVAIAAQIFVSAGVILLYIINLNYAQRIMRAYHPAFSHSKPVKAVFVTYYVSVVMVLIMVITVVVISFYTLNTNTLLICRDIQRFAIVYFTVFCFMPWPIILISWWTSKRENKVRFGKLGTLTHQVIIVLIASAILTTESLFRVVTTLLPARLLTNPAWYHGRTAFYCFLPTLEVLVVILYALTRVDQRFFVEGKAERRQEAEEKQGMRAESNE